MTTLSTPGRLLRWLRRGSSARELRGMSDRELTDLGIGRSEIAYLLADGPAELRELRAPALPARHTPRALPKWAGPAPSSAGQSRA